MPVSGTGLSQDDVLRLVADVLGVRPLDAERMPFGHFNVTYDVALPDRHVIVRTNRDPAAMAGAARNLEILSDLGLPVPHVLASGPGYLILEKIPGRDLGYELPGMTRQQMSRLAEQVADFQRVAATLPPGDGHGWRPIGAPGRFPSWTAVVEHDLEKGLRGARHVLAPGDEPALRRAAAEMSDHFESIPPTCFLDDLTTKNVIVERGELRGIVDFDVVCYGDPRYWLGLTTTAVVSIDAPEGAFYVDELLRLWGVDDADRRLVAFYAGLFALDFISEGHPRDASWLDRMRELIAVATIRRDG